jgi:hypothetical protein
MASEAQVLANGRNSRLARGATTLRGRMVSSQNARKRGLRAATDTVLREAGIAYEERKQKWLKELNPRTDREEFLAHQQVITSLMVERVHAAHIEQITSEIEGVDDRQAENVHRLGRRLYFNRAGSGASFGCAPFFRQKAPKTSASGLAVDPDDPAMLVAALEDSAEGCAWLAGQWRALRERLEGRNFWQAIDRFRAIRLLAAQPIDAGFDEVIAEIFIASHGIEPPRKRLDYDDDPDPEPAGNRAFADLKSDLSTDELIHFVEGVRVRWPDMVSSKERVRCREILVNLVDTQIQRLTELQELHEQNTEHEAQRTVTRLGFDRSRDAELMRRYELRYRVALDRTIKTYERVHGKDQGDNDDPTGRGAERRVPVSDSGLRGKRGGTGTHEAPASAAGCTADDDTEWAREINAADLLAGRGDAAFAERQVTIDAADVLACGGYLPERFLDGLTGDGEPSPDGCDASGAGTLDALIPAVCGSGLTGNAEPGGDAVDEDACRQETVASNEDLAVVTHHPSVVESNTWRPSVGGGAGSGEPRPTTAAGGAGSGEPRPTTVGGRAGSGEPRPTTSGEPHPTTPEAGTDGGLDKRVTNEPNPAETVSLSQPTGEITVTTNSGVGSALDKVESESNGEDCPVAEGVADPHEDGAPRGGRSPTQHGARAPAAASRREKKKMKRDGRQERKALTQRELERRLRAYEEGDGTVAETNKLIDDLREALMQLVRELMGLAARAP